MMKQLRSLDWYMFAAGAAFMLAAWELYLHRYGQAAMSLGVTLLMLWPAIENQRFRENHVKRNSEVFDTLTANIKRLSDTPRSLFFKTQQPDDSEQQDGF